jgi:subfamily B ATP-binding cassette protein MsbA
MRRIFEFLEIPTEPISKELKHIDLNKNITFKNVEFKYDEEIILQNFQLELEHGKIYAIVGTSGCGKSTIVNLLCRFYNIGEGTITFGDKNIEDIDPHELRKHIAIISQDNQLFHDSILENIRYGKLDCSKQEIENVINLVGLDDFIRLSTDGEDSIIGNEGTKISGGQKQRIAIARALLKNADLIVLDEATSALDSESENNIFNNVLNLFKGKTIIFISHRLSAVKNVDEIICLNSGRIAEKGNHNDLVNLRGTYWELFKQQIE